MKELKGRSTIRRNGSATGATGTTARVIKRWGFDPQPNTTLARLEDTYLTGLDAFDDVLARNRGDLKRTIQAIIAAAKSNRAKPFDAVRNLASAPRSN